MQVKNNDEILLYHIASKRFLGIKKNEDIQKEAVDSQGQSAIVKAEKNGIGLFNKTGGNFSKGDDNDE